MNALKLSLFVVVGIFLLSAANAGDGPIAVSLKDHKFSPAEIHVKANVPNMMERPLRN